MRRFGRLDALVNNAGVTRFVDQQNLEGLSGDDFNHIFSTNVTANYQMVRAAVTALRGAPNPSIVNISSNSGFTGMGSSMAYAASKGALNTMTLSMARTLAPDIRVNAVCPGFVDTSWWKAKLSDDELDQLRNEAMKYLPLNRVVTAEDVADAVRWLICGARTVTGQLLTLDSGAHLTAVRS